MRLPPLSALEALEALSRHGSVSSAADALGLSQSAVSHKLKGLQDRLGFQLLQPKGRGVVLTGQARQYLAAISPALDGLRAAHGQVAAAEGQLVVACASGFAASWLASRLHQFRALFPDVDLFVRSTHAHGNGETADVAIIFAEDAPSHGRRLHRVTFFPVCSPGLFHATGTPRLRDLAESDLLHLGDHTDWSRWLGRTVSGGVVFSDFLTMLAAAEAGQGVALGDAVTCDIALSGGRLIRPYAQSRQVEASYWVVPGSSALTGAAEAFISWLEGAVQAPD